MAAGAHTVSVLTQLNEVLCKVLAHNLCCLVQSMYKLGIEPEFWKAVS